jgi:hypothetical protein
MSTRTEIDISSRRLADPGTPITIGRSIFREGMRCI